MATESTNHPAFDSEEHKILGGLNPTLGPDGESESLPGPTEEDIAAAPAPAPSPAPAPAPAAAAPAPAAPAAAPAAPAQAPAVDANAADTLAAPAGAPTPEEGGSARAALRASRRSESKLRERLKEAEAQLEKARKGEPIGDTEGGDADQITDEDLAELESNFPALAKVAKATRAVQQQIAKVAPARVDPPNDEFEPAQYAPAMQEVIDSVPQLQAWQYDPSPDAQAKFLRAVEYDSALTVDPDWKDKPVVERIAEAARRSQAALGGAAAPAPAPNRTDPAQAIASAPAATPKSISDFRGGAPATDPGGLDFRRMSDEAVMASLPDQG